MNYSPRPVGGLLAAAEVAELLGVDETWVYRAARRGEIPHLRLGKYVRFRREDIDEWIASRVRRAA